MVIKTLERVSKNYYYIIRGEVILKFDLDGIKSEGYDVTTPILITDMNNYKDIIPVTSKQISQGEKLLKIV